MTARDPRRYGSPEVIDRVLDDTQVWFIVGLGNNPDRDAFGVSRLLKARGQTCCCS